MSLGNRVGAISKSHTKEIPQRHPKNVGEISGEYKALFERLQDLDIGYMKEGRVAEMVENWNDFSSLTSLTIKMSTHLSKILISSRHLKKIKILDGRTQTILPILSLPTPSASLQSITFKFVEFDENDPWELLSSFTNLEKLKLINCWIHPDVDYEAKKVMGFKVTRVKFKKLKLFVCSNPRSSGMSVENEGKTLLVQWGVLQHAMVVSENLESRKTRIYYEKLDK
ncbi:5374_t:CDS:2, partial [Acaulospora colombiana]